MENIVKFGATDVASVVPAMSASRGILAMQGIDLSSATGCNVQPFGGTQAHIADVIVELDKPSGGWHQAFAGAIAGDLAAEAAYVAADLRAARLRNAHPATVIRSRHRSRLG